MVGKLPGIFVSMFLLSAGVASADELFSIQVGAFGVRGNAEGLVDAMGRGDVRCRLVERGSYFKVLCGELDVKEKVLLLGDSLRDQGYKDSFLVSYDSPPAPEAEGLPVATVHERPPGAEHAEMAAEAPAPEPGGAAPASPRAVDSPPTGRGGVSGDVFGRKGGHIHPFLSLTGVYTDNLYNLGENRVRDYETIISPGLWIAVPRRKDGIRRTDIEVSMPGGRRYGDIPGSDRRFLMYLFYEADLERFRDNPSEDFNHQNAEGHLRLKSRGGFTVGLSGQYGISHDDRGTAIAGGLDEYINSLGNAMLAYDFGKLELRFDYSRFDLDYKEAVSDFRDRGDEVYSGYVSYKVSSKTSLFIEHEYIDISYSINPLLYDSAEHNYLGGIRWALTGKSTGMLKGGYGVREFADPSRAESRDFIIEADLRQNFTPKTSLSLVFIRQREETDIEATGFVLANRLRAGYSHRLTYRVSCALGLSYAEREYEDDLTYPLTGGETKQRKDDIYNGSVAFKYEVARWLSADVGYAYTERKSSFSAFDYSTNRAFFRVNMML